MKALLDTNSLISALLVPPGPSGQIVRQWRASQLELAVSPDTLAQLIDVLHRRHILKKYPISESNEVAPGLLVLDAVPDDPKDNHVLAVAIETACDYIVSGDRHLLDLHDYQGIKIVSPREFLTLLSPSP